MKRKGYILFYIGLIVSMIMMSGCWVTIPYERKSEVEKQLTELRIEHQAELTQTIKNISAQKHVVITNREKQLQSVVNSLYGADMAFSYYLTPDRIDLIINNRVNEAMAAAGFTPTYDAVVLEKKRLKDELDETKTSMEQLQKNHDKVVEENKLIAQESEAEKAKIAELESIASKKETEWQSKLDDKQDELNNVNNDIIVAEKKRGDNQASIERLKMKLMWACGIAAVLCIAGSIYSPIEKSTLTMLAAIFGGVTVAIPFIEGWMVLVAGLVGVAIAVVKFLYTQNIATKTSKNLIGAIQEEKVKNPENFKSSLKPILQSWNTNYVKDASGMIVTKTDKEVENFISGVLMDTGQLDAKSIDNKS